MSKKDSRNGKTCNSGKKKEAKNEKIDLFGGNRNLKFADFEEHVKRILKKAKRPLNNDEMIKFFDICDKNQDGILDEKELGIAYEYLKAVIAPVTALIVVDVQNDFITGSLGLKFSPAKQDGAEVVPVINNILKKMTFDAVVYSYDYHPKDHISFLENVHLRKLASNSPIKDPKAIKVGDEVIFDTKLGLLHQRIWPAHCIQQSKGADLHKDLKVMPDAFHVYKGTQSNVESYTAFGNKELDAETCLRENLESKGVTEVYVTGLASDVCVGMTGRDALTLGYSVVMVEDAARGVLVDCIAATKRDLEAAGGVYKQSKEVIAGTAFTMDDRMDTLRRHLAGEIKPPNKSC